MTRPNRRLQLFIASTALAACATPANDPEPAAAAPVAGRIAGEGLEPVAVAHALASLAACDGDAYGAARREVLRSFEERDAFLEDVRVADTVVVLDVLARERGLPTPRLDSPLLS